MRHDLVKERDTPSYSSVVAAGGKPGRVMGIEVSHDDCLSHSRRKDKSYIGGVGGRAGRSRGDVDVEDLQMRASMVKDHRLHLHCDITHQQVLSVDGGELDTVVDEEGQAASPITRRTVPAHQRIAREGQGPRGWGQLGLLYGCKYDIIFEQEGGEFGAGVSEPIAVELQEGRWAVGIRLEVVVCAATEMIAQETLKTFRVVVAGGL